MLRNPTGPSIFGSIAGRFARTDQPPGDAGSAAAGEPEKNDGTVQNAVGGAKDAPKGAPKDATKE